MSEPGTIVVADDETHIRELLRMGLTMRGHRVVEALDGPSALAAIQQEAPALAVLDVNMPGLDGFEVARRLRSATGPERDTPVIFLTARDETADKVEGLRLSSGDYVTKPFSVEELVERVAVVLGRSDRTGGGPDRLAFADLEMDLDSREVRRNGELLELTPTEYRLLHHLMVNARVVLTREQLLTSVWDYAFTSNASVLETYVSYLRAKVDVHDPPLLHTVRGVGYVLRLPR